MFVAKHSCIPLAGCGLAIGREVTMCAMVILRDELDELLFIGPHRFDQSGAHQNSIRLLEDLCSNLYVIRVPIWEKTDLICCGCSSSDPLPSFRPSVSEQNTTDCRSSHHQWVRTKTNLTVLKRRLGNTEFRVAGKWGMHCIHYLFSGKAPHIHIWNCSTRLQSDIYA